MGVASGEQPLISEDGKTVLLVNGEIYNYRELLAGLKTKRELKTGSDCEVLLYLWEEHKEKMIDMLSGDFGFVLYDGEHFIAARDPIGVVPLYLGKGKDGSTWITSEMKTIMDDCTEELISFPPGHYYSSKTGEFHRYYKPQYLDTTWVPTKPVVHAEIRESLTTAVRRRLMSEVPFGVLLSGGLDSSLVASIASRLLKEKEAHHDKQWWGYNLHTFSVGIKGHSPDLAFAKQVADHIGSIHHEFTFTVQDGFDALENVIWHLETYDVTTIRASTPMYLMSRKIKATGCKMVLSGEGADEIYGGYLYFYGAPSPREFHDEAVRRVGQLYTCDCLRANKSTMAWGLEARVPFLDRDFLDTSFGFDPQAKMCGNGVIEKDVLRKAFDTPDDPYLPKDCLWRQKEQFSDGVGYNWIDGLIELAEKSITEEQWENRATLFPHDPPKTKEAFFYRNLFEKMYKTDVCKKTVKNWIPAWCDNLDPSGRVQSCHDAHQGALAHTVDERTLEE